MVTVLELVLMVALTPEGNPETATDIAFVQEK